METSKALLVLGASCAMLLLLLLQVSADEELQPDKYTTRYDNVDIDAVIRNERLLQNYIGCLLDRKPCSPDAAELKKNLPDALATNCSGCSEAQKRISDRLSHHLIDNRPAEWSLLEEKYDPTGAYRAQYLHSRDTDEEAPRDDETEEDNSSGSNASASEAADKDGPKDD